jgi:hypothetical protein
MLVRRNRRCHGEVRAQGVKPTDVFWRRDQREQCLDLDEKRNKRQRFQEALAKLAEAMAQLAVPVLPCARGLVVRINRQSLAQFIPGPPPISLRVIEGTRGRVRRRGTRIGPGGRLQFPPGLLLPSITSRMARRNKKSTYSAVSSPDLAKRQAA